jgi:hypothetical protein
LSKAIETAVVASRPDISHFRVWSADFESTFSVIAISKPAASRCSRLQAYRAGHEISGLGRVDNPCRKWHHPNMGKFIHRETVIRLSQEDVRLVLALMDNPPKPNKRLKDAVKAFKRSVRAQDRTPAEIP